MSAFNRYILYVFLLYIFLIFVISPAFAETKPAIVGADANEFLLIEPEWLVEELNNKEIVILDTRPATDYQRSHIAGAINIPVAETFAKTHSSNKVASIQFIQKLFGNAGIDTNTNIVLYDNGHYIDAGRMFWVLEVYGHRRTGLLNRGFVGWQKLSLAQSATVTRLPPKTFVAAIQPDRLATKLHTRLAIEDENKILLDARSTQEYMGKKSDSGRFGRIPTALNVPWENNFKKVNGFTVVRELTELQSLYKDIDNNKKIITYCNRGKQSSFSYFILRKLGRNVAHYDGSWIDWSSDPNLPIE